MVSGCPGCEGGGATIDDCMIVSAGNAEPSTSVVTPLLSRCCGVSFGCPGLGGKVVAVAGTGGLWPSPSMVGGPAPAVLTSGVMLPMTVTVPERPKLLDPTGASKVP